MTRYVRYFFLDVHMSNFRMLINDQFIHRLINNDGLPHNPCSTSQGVCKKIKWKKQKSNLPFFSNWSELHCVKIYDAIVLVSQPKINMYNHELQQGCGLITWLCTLKKMVLNPELVAQCWPRWGSSSHSLCSLWLFLEKKRLMGKWASPNLSLLLE